ncbi:hypothetical protein NMG60_11021280 [Bertholletia excelsa]
MDSPETGIIRSFRDDPPAHYILKIESFSLFLNNIQRRESATFESGGYTWWIRMLLLLPNQSHHLFFSSSY